MISESSMNCQANSDTVAEHVYVKYRSDIQMLGETFFKVELPNGNSWGGYLFPHTGSLEGLVCSGFAAIWCPMIRYSILCLRWLHIEGIFHRIWISSGKSLWRGLSMSKAEKVTSNGFCTRTRWLIEWQVLLRLSRVEYFFSAKVGVQCSQSISLQFNAELRFLMTERQDAWNEYTPLPFTIQYQFWQQQIIIHWKYHNCIRARNKMHKSR